MSETIDNLGAVIKAARQQAGITRKELAAKLRVSARHLMNIENSQQKPSYDLLYRLIRELYVPADIIFYPEAAHDHKKYARAGALLRICGDKELDVINLMLSALLKEK